MKKSNTSTTELQNSINYGSEPNLINETSVVTKMNSPKVDKKKNQPQEQSKMASVISKQLQYNSPKTSKDINQIPKNEI